MITSPDVLRHPAGQLLVDDSRFLLMLKQPCARERIQAILQEFGLELEDGNESGESSSPKEVINHSERRYWIRSSSKQPASHQKLGQLEQKLGAQLDWVGPVYRLAAEPGRRGMLCPAPNALLVKWSARNGANGITDQLKRYGLQEVPEKSTYLQPFHYFVVQDLRKSSSYEVAERLAKSDGTAARNVRFEHIPMVRPTAHTPNDPLYTSQWDMTRIGAGGAGTTGWDLSTGQNNVVICILDTGCDLQHPDLQFSDPGINLGTMLPDGSPTGKHGTACAGIAAARIDNSAGVAGVAGGCRILPLAFDAWTESEVAAGIRYAATHGAQVISMSFGSDAWDPAIIDPAIQDAFNAGLVMCVATHNYDSSITYPATNPLVMACGASDEVDNRKSPTSPDGENWWGSDFGPEISVVAPGVHLPTTDQRGSQGYNTSAGAAGDYCMSFGGTSGATPHVAGLAALLFSLFPTLTNVQVRNIIERTAEKVGTVAYATDAAHPNGTWNQETGYGRINVLRALDLADVLIRDYPADTGLEPSTPPGGDFWDFSDIVVRASDDDIFLPQDLNEAHNVERGQTNYVYVRVTNPGPNIARNVAVNVRITPWIGLQFAYPDDWNDLDAMHVSPTPIAATFATVAAGTSVLAKFSLSAQQVDTLWGWSHSHPWHPCVLASVQADNDYAYLSADLTGGNLVTRRNNFAQRNLSVVDLIAGATASIPLVAGHRRNREEFIDIEVDRAGLPRGTRVTLHLDEERQKVFKPEPCLWSRVEDRIQFLERARIATSLAGTESVLVLEAGSSISLIRPTELREERLQGGRMVLEQGRKSLEFEQSHGLLRLAKMPGEVFPLLLRIEVPASAKPQNSCIIRIAQRDAAGTIVGGAGIACMVKAREVRQVDDVVSTLRLQPSVESPKRAEVRQVSGTARGKRPAKAPATTGL